ncbi:dapdiamide synthesis protein DdaC-like isoform X2 [Ptychodera flava]|uniref:dapdiamide synthesis protein DdaC-like isoform X2 n=1 Tax=Ptychodera flava TaxID=63121 RepID=UPI00396A817E
MYDKIRYTMGVRSIVSGKVSSALRGVNFSRCSSTSSRLSTKFEYAHRVEIPPQTTALLAGRRWLPGALRPGSKFPDYLASPRDNFPALYTVKPSASISDFAKGTRDIIERELHVHGALLFRGVPVQSPDDFSQFMQGLEYSLMGYYGGSGYRSTVTKDVMTASDDLPEYTIEPHNEMAYLEQYPMKFFLYCDVPPLPNHGGESVIVDGRQILPRLDPGLVEKLKRLGIRYYRQLPSRKPGGNDGYSSWQEVFSVEEKPLIEKFMTQHRRSYRWEPDGALTFWYNLPATIVHPKTGQEVWFNQLSSNHASYFKDHPAWAHVDIPDDKYPCHTYYGDGSEFEEEVIQHIREVMWETSVGFQMQRGDVIVLDNLLTLHARLGFRGRRRLLVGMSAD